MILIYKANYINYKHILKLNKLNTFKDKLNIKKKFFYHSIFMSKENKIHLKPCCILTVPFQIYENDFSFIVNGKEFKTSRLISDILSPNICRIHADDPTIDTFTINTHEQGDFSLILQLVTFKEISFSESEARFISEVIEILGNNSIEFESATEITVDNVFKYIKKDEKKGPLYRQRLLTEIDFISSHFYEICESNEKDLISLSIDTLFEILSNNQLQLRSEDQLLNFVNKLYMKDESKYSILYETVFFENVSIGPIREFLSIFDCNDITGSTWKRLSGRLSKEVKIDNNNKNSSENLDGEYEDALIIANRYTKNETNVKTFLYSRENEFKGIINYLKMQSNGEVNKVINITASSVSKSSSTVSNFDPSNVILYEDSKKIFMSENVPNSWICFDFKNNKIIPTEYSIKSSSTASNSSKPKSWVIEGSNDNNNWEMIDEQSNCPYLNGANWVHTFTMKNQNSKEFRFIRMRLTGLNWKSYDTLVVNQIEFYGKLK